MTLKRMYNNRKPIGVYPTCNFGGVIILDMQYDIDDSVVTAYDFGDGYKSIRHNKVYYSSKGAYIVKGKTRYYLSDFMRVS